MSALRCRSAGIHVAAAVDVVVDFSGASCHAAEQERGECRHFHRAFAELALAVTRPQEFQQHRGNDGIDVDAEHVGGHAVIVQGLYQRPVIIVENIFLATFLEQACDVDLSIRNWIPS